MTNKRKINIRLEKEIDYKKVESITKEAFTREDYECDEHFIVHQLRKSKDCIKELNLVLEIDGEVIGHIIYSKSKVIGDKEHQVITLGPVSVKPEHQGKGYGSLLIRESLEKAKTLGYPGVIIYGHPQYYPRFGFKNAEIYDITTNEGKNGDYFMALELNKDGLKDVSGKLLMSHVFNVDKNELRLYNQNFNQPC